MTKSELIDRIYGLGFDLNKRDVEILVHALFDVLQAEIAKTGRLSYPGFGTFTVRERKARTGRNPQTGKAIQIAASKTVGFKPSPGFKGSL